jgi:hypothetical protein
MQIGYTGLHIKLQEGARKMSLWDSNSIKEFKYCKCELANWCFCETSPYQLMRG